MISYIQMNVVIPKRNEIVSLQLKNSDLLSCSAHVVGRLKENMWLKQLSMFGHITM